MSYFSRKCLDFLWVVSILFLFYFSVPYFGLKSKKAKCYNERVRTVFNAKKQQQQRMHVIHHIHYYYSLSSRQRTGLATILYYSAYITGYYG